MKTKFLTLISLLLFSSAVAQTNSNVIGIVRKNYYSTVISPVDSTITFQVLDSSTIRLGNCDATTGLVTNLGTAQYKQSVNLTGAALNPYTNTYVFLSGNSITSFDITSGNIISQAPITNINGSSYFDNFRFNHSDSSIYGLARRSYFDTISNTTLQGVFLAKANPTTGSLSEISTSALAPGFALVGSAIDPYQMLYYFSTGNNLIGVDMYNGAIFSNVSLSFTNGFSFGNFTYSCVDTALYGLVRQKYYSTIPDPNNPNNTIQVLDSATLKLGRVNPNTGVVTNISAYSIGIGSYTINGGAAVDPVNRIYYFSSGSAIVGVSMLTGQIVSNQTYSFTAGDYFDLMRNTENCYAATRIRQNPNITATTNLVVDDQINIFPNPSSGEFTIKHGLKNGTFIIYDILGQEIMHQNFTGNTIHLTIQKAGIYTISINNGKSHYVKHIMVQN